MEVQSQQFAIIKVRFSPFFNELIEFDVELSPVPVNDKQGKDVTVNWKMYDGFDANKTFWTDSNGLQMQKRIINYRETFDVVKDTKQNISSNFYPVTSAIAIRDIHSTKQVTILNDRCQAGSAGISKNTIELNQNRRLIQDDIRGVEEPLNERDSKGKGLRVNARYYMHIFDRLKGQSKQRTQQQYIDQSIQYFFAMKYSVQAAYQNVSPFESKVRTVIPDNFKTFVYQAYPLGKHKIQLRIENLYDLYDTDGNFNSPAVKASSKPFYVDLYKFCRALWQEANPKSHKNMQITIRELSLSGNQLESDNQKWIDSHSRKWVGRDDATRPKFQGPADVSGFHGVALEPQRIRTFEVYFKLDQTQLI